MKRVLLACLLCACAIAGVGPAEGQAPPAAQGGESDAYQAAISEAVAEFSAGRWEEARSLFTEAHRINPNARTLRGLGMAAFELRNYVEALQMLQRALDSQVNPLTPEQRQKTQDLLERTRSFIGMFEVEAPEGTALSVDGVTAAYDERGALLLNSGKRRIGIRFSDGAEATRVVDVRGGEQGTLVFERPASGPAPTPPPVPVPVQTAPGQVPPPGGQASGQASGQAGGQASGQAGGQAGGQADTGGGSVLPIVLTAGGGVLIAGGVVTGLLAKGAESDLEKSCPAMVNCTAEDKDTADRANTLATVTNVLWIGGAVAAALGITLLVIEGGEDEPPPVQASVGFGQDSVGMNVWGRF